MSHLPPPNVIKQDGVWSVDGRPRETIIPLYHAHPTNTPDFSLITMLITLPPRAAVPPHTHGGAAVMGNIVKGTLLNQVNDDPIEHFGVGVDESGAELRRAWFENPGCHHVRNENLSETDEVVFVAVMLVSNEILDRVGMEGLVVLDAAVEEEQRVKEREGGKGSG